MAIGFAPGARIGQRRKAFFYKGLAISESNDYRDCDS
jgi:hypothetical protein